MRPHLNDWLGMLEYACRPSFTGSTKLGGSRSRPVWVKNEPLAQDRTSNDVTSSFLLDSIPCPCWAHLKV
jgi:hypothetical protein